MKKTQNVEDTQPPLLGFSYQGIRVYKTAGTASLTPVMQSLLIMIGLIPFSHSALSPGPLCKPRNTLSEVQKGFS